MNLNLNLLILISCLPVDQHEAADLHHVAAGDIRSSINEEQKRTVMNVLCFL